MEDVIVSVFMLTYNQENYIGQAIEGVLGQKTNFMFELVIGDDSSTDKTVEICKNYQQSLSQTIEILENSENAGIGSNFLRTSKELKGKYIAICDGDDYWIDEHKLQKQVDFLENHPDYSIIFGNYKALLPNGNFIKKQTDFRNKQTFSIEDLIIENFIPSVTVLFKNVLQEKPLPEWIGDLPYGDWPTYLWSLNQGGKILYMDEFFAVYRTGIGESFKLRRKLSRSLIVEMSILNNFLYLNEYKNWESMIKRSLYLKKKSLMLSYNREGKYLLALKVYLLLKLAFQRGITRIYLFSLQKKMFA